MDLIQNKLEEIKEKIEELEKLIVQQPQSLPQLPQCWPIMELTYVNLSDGTTKDKIDRIVKQIEQYKINIIPTPTDSQIVRSAIVGELGNEGLNYWLRIRSLKEDYDEQIQMGSYMYLLARREKININLGAIINRYRTAINKYNNRLNQQ